MRLVARHTFLGKTRVPEKWAGLIFTERKFASNYKNLHFENLGVSIEASIQSQGFLGISFLPWLIMISSMAKRKWPKGRIVG